MHPSTILTLLGFMAGSVLADNIYTFEGDLQKSAQLWKRQSQAFTPISETRRGRNCQEAFGAGALQCGDSRPRKCYLPADNESCCYSQYTCPGGSFCLASGKCCPNGVDPATCATQQGVRLPPNFDLAAATRQPSAGPTGVVDGGNGTFPQPTATATGSHGPGYVHPTAPPSGTDSAPIFTGAAQQNYGQAGGLAAVAIGFVGLLGNLI